MSEHRPRTSKDVLDYANSKIVRTCVRRNYRAAVYNLRSSQPHIAEKSTKNRLAKGAAFRS